MGVVHRTIFTWFTLLIFLILLVLRLDGQIQWNWFVVFIPVWIFNAILLIYVLFRTTSDCKNRAERGALQAVGNGSVIAGVFLLLLFEVVLCLKLEYPAVGLRLHFVLLPLWILLSLLIVRVFCALFDPPVIRS